MVLMFTDIVDSVALKKKIGDVAYLALLERHRGIIERAVAAEPGGRVIEFTGDGLLIRFNTPGEAVRSALRFQHALAVEPWGEHPIRVRTGIHSGTALEIAGPGGRPNVSGLAVDVTARVMGLALPGQILITRQAFDDARQYVRDHPTGATPALQVEWMAHGPYLFKGSEEPLDVFEVGASTIAPLRHPPDGEKARRAVPAGEEAMYHWRPALGLEVPRRAGWRIERKLGEGGFGEVWLAQNAATRERRVFKFCFDAGRLRSFRRELTLFRLLREALGDRRDIARLYDVSLEQPPFYLESEYSAGGDLRAWAEKRGGIARLPLEARLDLLRRVAEAVAAAHSVGVLHKDLKWSNILMESAEGGELRPKLSDFGIGVLADRAALERLGVPASGFTISGLTMNDSSRTGTRLYSPPESLISIRTAEGEETASPFTAKGDVFALGVMLYQVVIGDLDRPLATGWERGVEGAVPDPLLRRLLIADISLMAEGDPDRRLGSAAEAAVRLRTLPDRRAQLEREEGARAAAEEAERRAALAEARRRRLKAGAAAAVAVLMVLLAGSIAAYVGIRSQRDAAQAARAEAEHARGEAEGARARAEAGEERARRESVVGRGHDGPVSAVAYSSDGRWVISGGWDRVVRLWRIGGSRGMTTSAIVPGHQGSVLALAFSPDGARALSGGMDRTLRLWQLDGVGGIREVAVRELPGRPYAVAFAAGGGIALSCGDDRMLRLWRVTDPGALEAADEKLANADPTAIVRSVAVSQDGKWAVTGGYDAVLRVWKVDGEAGRLEETASSRLHGDWIVSVALTPDGRLALSGSADHTIRVWKLDGAGGLTPAGVAAGHADVVKTVAISPDGNWVLSGGVDRSVRLWHIDREGALAPAVVRTAHAHTVSAVAWSPGGRSALSAGWDQTIRLWRLDGAGALDPATAGEGHDGGVNSVALSPDGRWALSGGEDSTVRLWRAEDGALTPGAVVRHNGGVRSVAFSADGRWALSAGADRTVRLWRVEGGGSLEPAAVGEGHTDNVTSACFSPNGAWAFSASDDRSIRIWHLDGRGGFALARAIPEAHGKWVTCVACSADGRWLLTGSSDKSVKLWRLDGAGSATETGAGGMHTNSVSSVSFAPDGKRALSASLDGTLGLWPLDGKGGLGLMRSGTGHTADVYGAAFSPDGRLVFSGGVDRTVRTWTASDTLALTPAGRTGQYGGLVNAVAWSHDGHWGLSGGMDGAVRLWRLSEDGSIVLSAER